MWYNSKISIEFMKKVMPDFNQKVLNLIYH